MAGKRKLHCWCIDTNREAFRGTCPAHKYSFGEVQLVGNSLHCAGINAFCVWKHGKRVSRKGPVGEDVKKIVFMAFHRSPFFGTIRIHGKMDWLWLVDEKSEIAALTLLRCQRLLSSSWDHHYVARIAEWRHVP